jgi:predicted acyl esterase
MAGDYMTYDQRFASQRPDVLVYQTDPLDRDVTITGPVTSVLHVSTTGTDSDFIVKLIDVYPNDYPDPTPNPNPA